MNKPAVLLVSYHFYPSSEVGAKRPSETAHYLAKCGYDVTVIRAIERDQPALSDWAGFDSLRVISVKVPRKIITSVWLWLKRMRRTESTDDSPATGNGAKSATPEEQSSQSIRQWIRRQLLAFDTLFQGHKLWLLKVNCRCLWLRLTRKIDIVIASGPPFVGYIGGLAASRIFSATLVLDFRDPWFLNSHPERITHMAGHPLANWEDSFAQRCVSRSSLITVAAPGTGRHIQRSFAAEGKTIKLVRNGFDQSVVITDDPPTGRLAMLYAGTIYWNRNPFPFLEALAEVVEMPHVDRGKILFIMVGYCNEWNGVSIQAWIDEHGMQDVVQIRPPVGAEELRELTKNSNLLINFSQGQPDQIPAKSYEMLASHRDLLIVCNEDDDVAELFREAGIGEIVNPDDTRAKKTAILTMYEKYVDQHKPTEPSPIDIKPFSRGAQVEAFEQLLRLDLAQ